MNQNSDRYEYKALYGMPKTHTQTQFTTFKIMNLPEEPQFWQPNNIYPVFRTGFKVNNFLSKRVARLLFDIAIGFVCKMCVCVRERGGGEKEFVCVCVCVREGKNKLV